MQCYVFKCLYYISPSVPLRNLIVEVSDPEKSLQLKSVRNYKQKCENIMITSLVLESW